MSTALKPIDELRQTITRMEPQFKVALPPQLRSEHFVRVLQTVIQQSPGLLELDRTSLLSAMMQAAQDGLLPDAKEGAIVPFNGRAKWIPMISGILKKMRNSGEVIEITVQMVREGEQFDYHLDHMGKHLRHTPTLFGKKGRPIGVYAMLKTKSGGTYFESMNEDEINAVKAISKTSSRADSPWNTWPDEMWKKSALRKLSKIAPMSTDVVDLIRRDDDMYDLNKDTPPQPEVTKPSRLSRIVETGLVPMDEQEVVK